MQGPALSPAAVTQDSPLLARRAARVRAGRSAASRLVMLLLLLAALRSAWVRWLIVAGRAPDWRCLLLELRGRIGGVQKWNGS